MWKICDNKLIFQNKIVFENVKAKICCETDPQGSGVFIQAEADKPCDWHSFDLGEVADAERFMSCFRPKATFMHASAGTDLKKIPKETFCLIIRRKGGDYLLLLPIMDDHFRGSLMGKDSGGLLLVAESGDTAIRGTKAVVLYASIGTDPYKLMEDSAKSITARMKSGRLRENKPLPELIDYFGWCTYNAFYFDVNHEKYCAGLESFKEGNIQLGFTIIDDGWQSVTGDQSIGQRRLKGFQADCEKFPEGIEATVKKAKEDYGINKFLVWHAAMGYWAGVDAKSFYKYETNDTLLYFAKGIQNYTDAICYPHTMINSKSIHSFYNDYHDYLRQQGVDGVKVDTQYVIEGISHIEGGRVKTMKNYHSAIEGSIQTHFKGNLINCMSCSNDMLYCTLNSNLIRESEDFCPDNPEKDGLHIQANAYVSFWMGEFSYTDWDMFWSKHPQGAFHAAARVVGGSPIYVSDKVDEHDFDILDKLVLSDGTVLRPQRPGRPTIDCLVCNPLEEDVLLKIFNYNEGSSIIGAFNVQGQGDKKEKAIKGTIKASDVYGIEGEEFAIYRFGADELNVYGKNDEISLELYELEFEIFTIVPIDKGIAPIGLKNKYNSAGSIIEKGFDYYGNYSCKLRDGGTFISWCQKPPVKVIVNGNEKVFQYANSILKIDIGDKGKQDITILF